jgi:dimethylhistidine N-methyltransferase
MHLYDAKGSQIFQRIMALDEYYPTRSEREILEFHGEEIVAPFRRRRCTLVDLGAGDGTKTRLLLSLLYRRSAGLSYAPIDLSAAALWESSAQMAAAFPGLHVAPVVAEYAEGLKWLATREGSGALLVLFLGSNIGNLERSGARGFLGELRAALRPGDHVLVGFDLLKDVGLLRRAYDDGRGVTAAFNLNLLARMNRELGADFDLSSFAHRATFDPTRPAMESWLESLRDQAVTVADRRFTFASGEVIHTEISCKYRESDVTEFARAAGFAEVGRFRDRRSWFLDALWRVPGRAR